MQRRRVLDWMIHLWARASLVVSNLFFLGNTRLLGVENLPPPSETVVYVPNHTTFFDILLLSGTVPILFYRLCSH
jgi:1-acyl-sn-glycerol-3-phosphate acyltransferase